MELTDHLGQEIIHRLSKYIDVAINLMDPTGKIVASTDHARINQVHGGAQKVIETLEAQQITKDISSQYSNTKPGVNLPIFHRGELAGVVGLTGDPDQVYQAAGMTQGSVEIALEQLYIQKQSFYQERQWNHWFHRLMSDEDIEELEKEARYSLRADLKKAWQVVVFQTPSPFDFTERLRRQAEQLQLRPLFILPFQENSVVMPLPFQEHLPPFQTEGPAAVGEPGYSAKGIYTSFQQASQTIEIAGKAGEMVYSGAFKVERLLSSITKETYIEITEPYAHRLNRLEAPYLETLDSFFKNDLKMSRTADELHVHRNTLHYRLDQVHKKVGLDARCFKDAIILQAILINP
ncbi:sugar diacid recognition domain-containing protein [Halobacillus sp. HZG1]|uniref:CdaR family transcriptional regulator n=1 Tax=Halobacillus sp. HZG1 TaxID=3111769 RepID=UPI002DBF3D99|nr:sugar diacid recognition domain-containing protein [Halobacillus sp. HZG1]MEC3883946.1 sugar diacid recognition domain-containing protein [Halobacillus sp. HZG1]